MAIFTESIKNSQILLQTASAAGMPQKLLVPEPPTNYKITITRSYDPAINWQITVLEDGDLYASGKETDLEDEKTILDGTVLLSIPLYAGACGG